jgi:glutamine synthetase
MAFAVMVMAGLDGIKNKIDPPAPADVNIYKLTAEERAQMGIPALPGSLYEALEELKKSEIAKAALGDHIYSEFLRTKEREWDEFRINVSPWETERYLSRY